MSKITLFFINLFLLAQFTAHSQLLEEDNNILFMKANVLYDSDRYDEAVRLYNRILRDDPSFSRALFMRGKSKFALGAFKGTKNDLLEYIDQRGINTETIELLANSELKLNNDEVALTYLELLTKLQPYEGKYFANAANIHFDKGNKNKACEYWIQSAKLGNPDGAKQASIKCAYDQTIHLPSRPTEPEKTVSPAVMEENEASLDDPMIENIDSSYTSEEPEVIDVSVNTTTPHVDMDSSQDIVIDDELTLTFKSGIGSRKIDDLPNILMLSDQSGNVVIDLCIGGGGKVTSASLNNELTTIFRSSLSSLAIRKAKDIVFMPSLVEEQCGLLIFKINTEG